MEENVSGQNEGGSANGREDVVDPAVGEVTETRRRVKVYALNTESMWDDKGTGHVTCVPVEELGGLVILVHSEVDKAMLLETKVVNEDIYKRQQGTLIVWTEPDGGQDLALSFQEQSGCNDVWEVICKFQGKDPLDIGDMSVVNDSKANADAVEPVTLPPCERKELPRVLDYFNQIQVCEKERVAMTVAESGYVHELVKVFHMCEDVEDYEGLFNLFSIIKAIFLLNESFLFETLFKDDIVLDIVGILEYDTSLKERQEHRKYLTEKSNFKEVVPVKNPEILAKIHQTYRVQYIKDVILPRILDDATFSSLNSFVFFNNVEIVNHLQSDTEFLKELFSKLNDFTLPLSQRRDLVLFLQEFCNLAKSLHMNNRNEFYKVLCDHGLFDVFKPALEDEDLQLRMAGSEIFASVLVHDTAIVRAHMLSELEPTSTETFNPRDCLLRFIVGRLIKDTDSGMQSQLTEIIRTLIDTEEEVDSSALATKNQFLTMFYRYCIDLLSSPVRKAAELFTSGTPSNLREAEKMAVLLNHIVDLLNFCVQHHSHHIRKFIIEKHILKNVLMLLRSKQKFLVLSALRFFRGVIGTKNEDYDAHIISNHLFDNIVDAFCENGNRYNLLNSAVIELFDYVKNNSERQALIKHLVEYYRSIFEEATYVSTFKQILEAYQNIEAASAKACGGSDLGGGREEARAIANRGRTDDRTMDAEEEAYFEAEDYEVDSSSKLSLLKHNDIPSANMADIPSAVGDFVGVAEVGDDGEMHTILSGKRDIDSCLGDKVMEEVQRKRVRSENSC
eukprot:Nk52_evm95s226 gene=Nk52_evmTU95s226